MIAFIDKFRHSKYYEEKRRFLLFVFLLFLILFLAGYLFQVAYARYEVNTKLNANIKKALYILGTDNLSFNLEPDGIVPSDNPYVYKFSVSNFNEKNDTDVENATQGDQQASTFLNTLKKGQEIKILELTTKEAETSPPTRYNSGSMILAMENAGN